VIYTILLITAFKKIICAARKEACRFVNLYYSRRKILKKIIIIVLVFLLSVVTGCDSTDIIENDMLPVMIIQNAKSSGLSFIFENTSDKEYLYSSHYALYVRKNDSWELAEPIIDNWDWAFDDEGYPLLPNSTTDATVIDWQWNLGELPGGEYKFQKEILFIRSPSDFDRFTIENEFYIP
jgi:hypothetical protein